MLDEQVEDAEEITDEALRRRYADAVEAVAERVGTAAAAEAAGVDAEALDDPETLTVAAAAAVLALDADEPRDAEAIRYEIRDHVMLSMSSAVLDVDALAAELPGLDAREIQQKIEGRQPMTLGEYARINRQVSAEIPN
jgi:hypothetical protein